VLKIELVYSPGFSEAIKVDEVLIKVE